MDRYLVVKLRAVSSLRYFAKLGWGWTLLLVTPFLLLSNASMNRNVSFLFKRVLSLVVATACWYVCTGTFVYIENVTGSCFANGCYGRHQRKLHIKGHVCEGRLSLAWL